MQYSISELIESDCHIKTLYSASVFTYFSLHTRSYSARITWYHICKTKVSKSTIGVRLTLPIIDFHLVTKYHIICFPFSFMHLLCLIFIIPPLACILQAIKMESLGRDYHNTFHFIKQIQPAD